MMNIPRSVSVTTAVLVFFLFMCGFDEATHIVLFLFALLNMLIIWMVYSVLTYDYKSNYTFQHRFYEDLNIKSTETEDI
ncbi:MAG: hypothetical protein IPN79_16255 [Saprospiraceae bacterium]|nr:hypothetical protein [Saprospiraceae bacterium]